LPTLRRRLEALQSELSHEREAVAEIAECDQEELKELKAATAEQG
jgi:kinetochore protein Spc7/SPC105